METKNTEYPSAFRLFLIVIAAIFISEMIVMLVLPFFEARIPVIMRALVDSLLLLALVTPLMYLFFYRQLNVHMSLRNAVENILEDINYDLGERVKELDCLYEVSRLLVEPGNKLEDIYKGTVNIIPKAWQYEEIACARIIVEGNTYNSSDFVETPWRQAGYIKVRGDKIGAIEVFYREERDQHHEGPFLKEERALINGISSLLSIAIEQKNAENRLLLLKRAMETIEIGVTITDKNGMITYTNPAEARMHGYTVEDLIGRHASIFSSEKPQKSESMDIDKMDHWKRDSINVLKDGSVFPVQLVSTSVKDDNGDAIGIITVSEDITERKKLEEQLKELATTDPLTGCYNRRHFFELGEREFQRSKRYGHPLSLLMLDIDHFKKINDTYGHPIGDRTLKEMTETCLSTLRESDLLGRIGGEEFAILFVEAGLESAVNLAERIRKALSEIGIQAEKETVSFTVSIGVSASREDDTGLEDILKRTDDALYKAKNSGRNRVMTA
jgi:diguanylate cyclase (GGDEF)-like protein/PAS domain S-box-containing protein